MLSALPMALFFFCLGHKGGSKLRNFIKELKYGWLVVMSITAVFILGVAAICFGHPNMFYPNFHSVVMFVGAAVSGIVIILILGRIVSVNYISWVGRNSICFFLIEEFVIAFMREFWGRCVPDWHGHMPIWSQRETSMLRILIMFISVMLFSTMVTPIVMRCLNLTQRYLNKGILK